MQKKYLVLAAFVVFAGLLAKESLFIVDKTRQVLVRRLGEAVRVIREPGLNAKIPLIEDVIVYDNRLLNVYFDAREVVVKGAERGETKRAMVDAYAKYRIVDPLKFFRSVGDEERLTDRLTPVFENAMRKSVGTSSLTDLLSERRRHIMEQIKDSVNATAESFGIKVADVRVLRTDLPQKNSRAVYDRMIAQHEKEARQTRAEGEEQSLKIKSEADKNVRIALANAMRQSEIIRGEGEAQASAIYANAFSRDPQFYDFFRTMQAYQTALTDRSNPTKIVISPDNEFFRYFQGEEERKNSD
ncbi:MAG: protease modulator HflC [Rickettsiales bacterium]